MNQSSDTDGHSRRPTPIALAIYRNVRVGMVIIMVMLAAAVIIERLPAACWQSALSAYYYTSAHSILIAALLALTTLFIVYKGSSDTEDVLLTLAGVCTFVAAMVPQGRPSPLCVGPDNLPPGYTPAMLQNVWAVVIALGVGLFVMLVQHLRHKTRQTRSPVGILSLYIFWLIMAVGLIALLFFPDRFTEHAHGVAGTLMLSAFIATAFCTAYVVGREDKSTPHRRGYQLFYWGIAALMLLTLIAVLTVHRLHPNWLGVNWILVLETAVILEFAIYWVVQTFELWHTPDRRELLPEDARKQTKHGLKGLKSDLAEARTKPRGEKLLPFL